MKRALLVGLIAMTGCLADEEGDPPHADRMVCPTQLAITGGPYMVQCTIDFTSPDHDVHHVTYKAVDSAHATWVMGESPTEMPGVRDGSTVFTMSSTTAPALGALVITASLFEVDQGQSSNEVTATVNVVSP